MAPRTHGWALVAAGVGALLLSPAVAEDGKTQTTGKVPLVIRVGVDLVQIDASITDAVGRPVTDLGPEDFTLEVDGRKQPVSHALFFNAEAPAAGSGDSTTQAARSPVPEPERTLAFVVDDLNISFTSMAKAKEAMKKFAASWDKTEARVGVSLVSDETGVIRLSNSPRRFAEAVKGIGYNIRSDKGDSSEPSFMEQTPPESSLTGPRPVVSFAVMAGNPALYRENFQQRAFHLLSSINALRSVPGRKAVVFVSEGFTIGGRYDQLGISSPFESLFYGANSDTTLRVLRMITEVANRASVVIYTIDPSGLLAGFPGADIQKMPSEQARREAWFTRVGTQGTLQQLAEDTGGLSVYNRNDLKGGLNEIVNDQRAYYLVGFEPPKTAFDRSSGKPTFHSIKLRVNRPGVRVRSRAGFYGVTDDEVIERAPLMVAPEF